jgi:preprotein translocase subunit SecE
MKLIGNISKFLAEVKQELTKVSWSTRQEILGATMVVISITALLSVFIGISDLLLSKILSVLFQ